MIDQNEFHEELVQDVRLRADADGNHRPDAFFEVFCEYLVDVGELVTADRVHFDKPGARVDGYGGDPLDSGNTLVLLVSDFSGQHEIVTLGKIDIEHHFKRLGGFIGKALDPAYRRNMEYSSPGFGLAELIATRWPKVEKVRMILITDKEISTRAADTKPAGTHQGIPITYSIWDIARLYKFAISKNAREEIVIDFVAEFGQGLHALPAHLDNTVYESYLAVIPGEQLAAIYERWDARLLEQNVRVFLQAKGNVNKGIRNTIDREPDMFFAYNNGITATAEKVETEESNGAVEIVKLTNFQIVNGGQTTASIHAASRKKVDLSRVFVQMKLSVIAPSRSENLVRRISEYANSQNKVSAADFFSNHPYHIRMEEYSRRILARPRDGGDRESKWFYERARGQYNNARAYLSPAVKRRFELEFPRSQLFTKTDLAKYVEVWNDKPHIVSRGAQKNFASFAEYIAELWEEAPESFSETYFEDAIARAIVFRRTGKIVHDSKYAGGYRANIVAYAIAKLAYDVKAKKLAVDTLKIWDRQSLSPALEQAIALVSREVCDVLVSPPREHMNVTEWAKQQACWSQVKNLYIDWPQAFLEELIPEDEQKRRFKGGKAIRIIDDGIEAQKTVITAGNEFWRNVREWGLEHALLSETDAGVLNVAATWSDKPPSDKQCRRALRVHDELQVEGCPYSLEFLKEHNDVGVNGNAAEPYMQ